VNGKIVLSKSLSTSNNLANLGIDLINGVYLLIIQNSNHETVTKKLSFNVFFIYKKNNEGMRTILIFVFASIFLKSISQAVFLPTVNTEWHYRFGQAFTTASINETLKYDRDSILNNDTVKVLTHTRYFSSCNTPTPSVTIFKQKSDSVFFRNAITLNQWQLLVNYGAMPGQTWTFTIQNYDNTLQAYTVAVNSVSTALINSLPLKVLNVTYKTFNSQFSVNMNTPGTIYERFGDNHYLFNFTTKIAPVCDADYAQDILCYQDSTFGLKQFTAYSCNYFTTGEAEISHDEIFFVSPNPALREIFIKSLKSSETFFLQIHDLAGRMLYSEWLVANNHMNNLELDLTDGVYLLTIQNSNKERFTKKLVIAK
jgi:hypothetical protein